MELARAIEILKNMATTNKAANDVFHDFATRERARGQVTLRALTLRMKKEGFNHDAKAYAQVLKSLADCGFGDLRMNKRGNVIGVFGIRTTLQSIGKAIIGRTEKVIKYAPRNKYSPLKSEPVPEPALDPKKIEPREAKREILRALSGVDNLVRAILNDTSIPTDRRVEAAMVLLQK